MTISYGIFFNMSEADYFAIPALSASGIKHMRASPLDFWMRSPLNPNLAQVQEEEGPNSDALTLGKAFDVRIISGRAAFDAEYCAEFTGDGTLLRTQEQMKAACRERKIAVSGNKDELVLRMIESGMEARQFYDLCKEQYARDNAGKAFLSQRWLSKIELAAAMIEKDPVLSHAFTGGMPQVTIVWRCEKIGVDMKMRCDYLKPKVIIDLKTMDPKALSFLELPFRESIKREIVRRRYYVQAACYLEGASHAARFLREDMYDVKPPEAVMQGLLANHPKDFGFVFQTKGVAPQAGGLRLKHEGRAIEQGNAAVEEAKQTYRECMDHFGPDLPWVTPASFEDWDDQDVPEWLWH